MPTRPANIDPTTLTGLLNIETKGRVRRQTVERLRAHLESVIDSMTEGVTRAEALLTVDDNHSPGTEARARATLQSRRGVLRAEVRAATAELAAEELHDRLKRQLEQRSRLPKDDPRGRTVAEGSWRHGNVRPEPPRFHPRPRDEREIVAHKSFATPDTTLDEARWDRFLLDYDFYLFVNAEDGCDTVVAIGDDGEEEVHSIVDARTATVEDALDWLDETGDRFVFFRDATSGRGRVAYRRYDGHYGLLTPEDATS
jgi:ribosome-associated translation inhibitor RaiA